MFVKGRKMMISPYFFCLFFNWSIVGLQGLPRCLSGKEPACQCRRCGFDPWVRKIPWRREWLSTPVFLPGELHAQGSLVGYSPRGHKESDMTEHTRTHTHTHTHTHTSWTCTENSRKPSRKQQLGRQRTEQIPAVAQCWGDWGSSPTFWLRPKKGHILGVRSCPVARW